MGRVAAEVRPVSCRPWIASATDVAGAEAGMSRRPRPLYQTRFGTTGSRNMPTYQEEAI